MKRLFIVGCPRSGSTWMAHLLAQHPVVATFEHAKLFSYLAMMRNWFERKAPSSFIQLGQPGQDAPAGKGSRLKSVLTEEKFYALVHLLAAGVFDEVAANRPGVSTVVDKTPENGHQAEFILKIFPDAYFLHMVRDPRSTYCSLRAASRSWARWEFPTKPVDGGRFWLQEFQASGRIKNMTSRYLLVRYEDLECNGGAELGRIFEWLALDAKPDFCEKSLAASTRDKMRDMQHLPSGFVRTPSREGWREELSSGDARIIEYLTREEMLRLGYPASSKPGRIKPLRIWLQDVPEAMLAFLDQKLHRMTQLMHWGWKGRKLEWNDP